MKYKYQDSSRGEGCTIFGEISKCGETMIEHCVVCVVWEKNTIDKDLYTQDVIKAELDEASLKLLKKIYGPSNMENIEDSVNNPPTIEIPLELLKNIRNLIEITNSRIQWKTEELFPVGNLIKLVDDLLQSDQAK